LLVVRRRENVGESWVGGEKIDISNNQWHKQYRPLTLSVLPQGSPTHREEGPNSEVFSCPPPRHTVRARFKKVDSNDPWKVLRRKLNGGRLQARGRLLLRGFHASATAASEKERYHVETPRHEGEKQKQNIISRGALQQGRGSLTNSSVVYYSKDTISLQKGKIERLVWGKGTPLLLGGYLRSRSTTKS